MVNIFRAAVIASVLTSSYAFAIQPAPSLVNRGVVRKTSMPLSMSGGAADAPELKVRDLTYQVYSKTKNIMCFKSLF